MKKKLFIVLFILVWVACGVFNYGALFADLTHEFPNSNHRGISFFVGAWGPLGTIPALASTGFAKSGFMWAPPPKRTDLPPGYALEVNDEGEFRPIRKLGKRPLLWMKKGGTKQEAIDRAWGQYEHENSSWKPFKE